MEEFTALPQGLVCEMEAVEREVLASLALQVAAILASAGTLAPPEAVGPPAVDPQDQMREGESVRDREILQALDFEAPAFSQEGMLSPDPLASAPAEYLPLLRILLPEAAADPVTAMEVSDLTRERLRERKHGRLGAMAAELAAPSGPGGAVLVARGQEGEWLGAMNDIRLVLAQQLGIDSEQDAERAYALAQMPHTDNETAHLQRLKDISAIYYLISWWQESLVAAVLGSAGPA